MARTAIDRLTDGTAHQLQAILERLESVAEYLPSQKQVTAYLPSKKQVRGYALPTALVLGGLAIVGIFTMMSLSVPARKRNSAPKPATKKVSESE